MKRAAKMAKHNLAVAVLCFLILEVFAYSFWIGAQKSPADGGPTHGGQSGSASILKCR